MKKLSLLRMLALGLILCAGSKGFAQTNVIKINPFSLFVLTGNIKYERTFADKMSAQLGVFYGGIGIGASGGGSSGRISYSWLGVTPEFRYYLTSGSVDAPKGAFVAPYAKYSQFKASFVASVQDSVGGFQNADATATFSGYGGGVTFGYQFLFNDLITLEFFLGGGFISGSTIVKADASGDELEESTFTGLNWSGPEVRWGMTLGFAF